MKIKFIILLFFSAFVQAQVTKSEVYMLGTKLSFYPNQCGNIIPESAGKLTFCDRNENLGVVEESYGLNSRNINLMLNNWANEDEVFVTQNGLSIKKTDGTYENVPNIAIPDIGSDGLWKNQSIIYGGLVMPNNKVVFAGSTNYLNIYDRTLKSISRIEFSSIHYPRAFAYDQTNDLVWIIAISGVDRHLYSYNETFGLSYVTELGSIKGVVVGSNISATLTYNNNYLYFGGANGLYKINTTTFSTAIYNTSSIPSLPYDYIYDLKFDSTGALWMAASEINNGSIIKFDTTNETFEQFDLPRDTNPAFTNKFNNLDIDNTGTVWATALNYNGLIKLGFDQNTPQWEQLPLTDLPQLGIKTFYVPANINFKNNKLYFSVRSASSAGVSDVDQVLINDNGNWSSISDNETGNTSFLANKRFTHNLPDDDGGMWWFNSYDDVIVHRKVNDEQFIFHNLENISNTAAIDIDGKPILRSSFLTSKITKINTPVFYSFLNDTNQNVNGLVRHKDQVWWYNESTLEIKILKYNQVIATFNLDATYDNIYYFQVDSNGNAWFAKNESNGSLTIKKFNPSTTTTTDYTITESFGTIQKIVAAPNGALWFVRQGGLIYYNGTRFTNYLATDHQELNKPKSLVVDVNNIAYVLLNDNSALTKIEDPGTETVSFNTTYLEGINSILPALDHYRPDDLSIDNQGAIWTNASTNTIKLTDADTAKEYRTEGESYTLSGLIYNDLNENDAFDEGEEYAGQLVALKLNGKVYNTFTNYNGIYSFYLYEENATYEITLPTIDHFVTAADRQLLVNIADDNQNYEDNNFQLKPRFVNSLYVKSSSKTGAWGFVRENFENTYTTAIGNLTTSKTYNNLEVTYTFKNQDPNSTNVLPTIDDVKVYELDPNGAVHLINKIIINPQNNQWSVNADVNSYVQNELAITPIIISTNSQTDIKITIPTVSPLNTYIIEIGTGLFDPISTGEVINHGVSAMASDDFRDSNDNPLTDPILLFPLDDRDSSSGFPIDLDSPYTNPKDVYNPQPYSSTKQVYGPGPYATKIYSSYAPNDKMVDEGVADVINDRSIDRKWLTYTIRFENTGNFSAKDVVVTDVLDVNLDPNSVKIIEASAAYKIDILKNGEDESVLKFSFNNIFLPFDDANNDGYIKFRIKANEDIVENTIVNNTANIYFDQNPAIVTNTIQSRFLIIETLSTTDVVLDAQFELFPNPANNLVTIKSDLEINKIELFSVLGRKILESSKKQLDVSTIDKGTYILKITSGQGVLTKKLIVN